MALPRRRAGFTLIEMLAVVLIIGLLAAVIAPRFMGRTEEAKQTQAAVQIKQLRAALDQFHMDNGFYPSTCQGLEALVKRPEIGSPGPVGSILRVHPARSARSLRPLLPGRRRGAGGRRLRRRRSLVGPEPIPEPTLKRRRGGFTLLELMAVLVLLALAASLVLLQFDFSSVRSRQDVGRITAFLRARQAAALRTGVSRRARIEPDPLTISVPEPGREDPLAITLSGWSLLRPRSSVAVDLTPSGARASRALVLRNDVGQRVLLRPHRLFVFKPDWTSGEAAGDA